jgi:hypothetical protein
VIDLAFCYVPRRHSLIKPIPVTADDFSDLKSLELEQRLARIELLIGDIRNAIVLMQKRTISLQAQLDHLSARIEVP